MRIDRAPPRRTAENTLPMINVVFLLLIFFVLAGALQSADLYEIAPLSSRSETPAGQQDRLLIMDSRGRLAFEDRELQLDDLPSFLSARLVLDPETVFALKADGRVPTLRVLEVMERLRDAGVEHLVLLTLEPEG